MNKLKTSLTFQRPLFPTSRIVFLMSACQRGAKVAGQKQKTSITKEIKNKHCQSEKSQKIIVRVSVDKSSRDHH